MKKPETYLVLNAPEFEGYGTGSGHYDEAAEAKDRKENALHLMIMMVGIIFCLGVTTFLAGKDLIYYVKGTKQTVACNPSNRTVGFQAPDGKTYTVDISWAMTDENTIDIYYMGTDYADAMVMTNVTLWICCYVVFGILFFVGLHFILKNLKPKRHAV